MGSPSDCHTRFERVFTDGDFFSNTGSLRLELGYPQNASGTVHVDDVLLEAL